MNHRLHYCFQIFYLLLFLPSISFAQNDSLTLEVETPKNVQGLIKIAFYSTERTFLQKEFKGFEIDSSESKRLEVAESDIPEGEFAVAVYLDLNGNGKLDKSVFGLPTEPYGFSNNFRGLLSPPTWKETMLRRDQVGNYLVINIE